jgi:hypothetical protein
VPADGPEPAKVITLLDETGLERRFTMHDAFDLEGTAYYLVEGFDDPNEVLLLRESEKGLETVDGADFTRVMAALEQDKVD